MENNVSHRKLLIATRNKGKFPEIVALLQELPFEFINLNDVPGISEDFDVEESAMTIEGNAIIKAMTYGNKTGLLTLADDGGLEVDALGGRPGVHSARYAPGTDEDRCRKLLTELEGIAKEKRTARFRLVVAIYDPGNNRVRTCEGVFEGSIATQAGGVNGFGYDPIFISLAKGKPNAELTTEEKNTVSHRGIALRKARAILEEEFR